MGAFLLALLVGLGLIYWWFRDRDMEDKIKQAGCPHYHTRVYRVRDMRHPGGTPTKQCVACGLQWDVYPQHLTWKEFKREFDEETIDRERQYERHRRVHETAETNQSRTDS